jgi:hypothetical protein
MGAVVRWSAWDHTGLEHCELQRDAGGLSLDGVVIGSSGGAPFAARYCVRTDAMVRTRSVEMSYLGHPPVQLDADCQGVWTDRTSGARVEALAGCMDIDIAVTPATNTLAILRLGLAPGESAQTLAAYLPAPKGADAPRPPAPARQLYTCLTRTQYRYKSLTTGFTAEIEIDSNALVLDYPETFRRL